MKYVGIKILFLILFSAIIAPMNVFAVEKNPSVANFYLFTPINDSDARELAKWDVLILQMLAQENSAEQLRLIKKLNPKIIILAYIASEEFPVSMYKQWDKPGGLFYRLLSGITDEMWLRDSSGNHVTFWQDNWMLNATDYPTKNKRWNEYLAEFVNKEILSTGLWDGIFYDNVWESVDWINNKIDANNDRVADKAEVLNKNWANGMKKLFALTRQKSNKKIYIVGNGDRGYYGDINGIYFENFTISRYLSWEEKMKLYRQSSRSHAAPTVPIIGNTAPQAKGQLDYKNMRFGLGSALLENGYYALDGGDQTHRERWWYDEYDLNLGAPLSEAVSLSGLKNYAKDLWRRDFENGIVLVNPTQKEMEIDLGTDFEKIFGRQDPYINDGKIVSRVKIGARDGLILLKTFQTLTDVFFVNGSFVRFYFKEGQKARNGFFAFDKNYPGGAKIFSGDLNGNGKNEKIIVDKKKMEIFNSDGGRWFNDFPLGFSIKSDLQVAVGKAYPGKEKQLLITSQSSNKISLLNYHGKILRENIYPLGKKYTGGFTGAIGDLENDGAGEIIFGTSKGKVGEVIVFDQNLRRIKLRFYPYGNKYVSGVYVAIGDVNKDGKQEIITAPIDNPRTNIRIFNNKGKMIHEFKDQASFNDKTGSCIETIDVDYDGSMEIMAVSL